MGYLNKVIPAEMDAYGFACAMQWRKLDLGILG